MNQAVLLVASYPEDLLDEMEAGNSGPMQHDPLPGRVRLAVALYPSLLDLFDIDKVSAGRQAGRFYACCR